MGAFLYFLILLLIPLSILLGIVIIIYSEIKIYKYYRAGKKRQGNLLLIYILTPFILFFIYGSLNYSGFCFKEMHYISDKKKIRRAITHINKPSTRVHSIDGQHDRYKESIPYDSVDTFLKENPDCCEVIPWVAFDSVTTEPCSPTFWQRVFGDYHEAVRIRYTQKYIVVFFDKNRKKKTSKKIFRETMIGEYKINNCGGSARAWQCGDYAYYEIPLKNGQSNLETKDREDNLTIKN